VIDFLLQIAYLCDCITFAETNYLNYNRYEQVRITAKSLKRSPVGWFLESLQQTYNLLLFVRPVFFLLKDTRTMTMKIW